MGISTLIEAGGQKFLFDAGRGVLQRLGESRINIPAVDKVLFTHLHSDHIEGLPGLWMTSWFITKRNQPMQFWGPEGTHDMLDGMRQFMKHDVINRANPQVRASGVLIQSTEIRAGLIYDANQIRITAIKAEHGDGNPAFAYLFEHDGKKILITGDSTYTSTFAEAVTDADVTVCNVYAPSLALLEHIDDYAEPIPTVVRNVSAKLASPEQAARMFRETGAKLGVFTHNIFYDSSAKDIVTRVKAAGFKGDILIASDRQQVYLGNKIEIREPAKVPENLEINSLNFKEVLSND